jgi:hypothetical protein
MQVSEPRVVFVSSLVLSRAYKRTDYRESGPHGPTRASHQGALHCTDQHSQPCLEVRSQGRVDLRGKQITIPHSACQWGTSDGGPH